MNRKIIEYRTAFAMNCKDLDDAINAGLQAGYEIYGERTSLVVNGVDVRHYQTMVRYDSSFTEVDTTKRALKV